MRRIGVLALLLWAATIGSLAGAAEAHGKAVAKTRTGTRQSASKTDSKNNVKAASTAASRSRASSRVKRASSSVKQSSSRTRSHSATQARVRKARYTPERRPAAVAETGTDYAAGFKNGYQAGLAAARKQLGRDDTAGTPTDRSARTAVNDRRSFESSAPDTALQPAASEPRRTPQAKLAPHKQAMNETPEAEVLETQQLNQIATLHVNGSGMPAPLRGSLASLERQNDRVEADGLERILDEADLDNRIAHKLLVPLPASTALSVNPGLSKNHRYCRPWTAHFLSDLARAHQAAFHKPIQVNSAVRTVEYQKRLMNSNGNAAAAEGDVVSPHLTGATIDIAKQGLSRKELSWMRQQLLALQNAEKIDVEEEFAQACFHITVYKSYAPSLPPRKHAHAGTSQRAVTLRKSAGSEQENPASQLPEDLAVGVSASQGR
jgi:hypothetical protein